MKNKFLLVITISIISIGLLFSYCQPRPDPKNVIRNAFARCDQITNGHYRMERKIKLMSNIDTITVCHDTYFDKQTDDELYGHLFSTTQKMNDLPLDLHLMYTGNELFYYVTKSGSIFPKSKYEYEINNIFIKNPAFASFYPITNKCALPMPVNNLNSNDITLEYIGDQNIDGDDCYHIRIVSDPAYDATSIGELIKGIVIDFWVRKGDFLPLQYSVARDVDINGEIVTEYLQSTLTWFEFNNLHDKNIFTPESVPSHIHFTVGLPEPKEPRQVLETGSNAPDVELESLNGNKTIKLSETGKKVIMLNFFFISCPPCIEEIPILKGISDKYKYEDFELIGIHDEYLKTSSIEHFIEKYGIDYPVFIGRGNVVTDHYPITEFPTAYIISEGKVIYNHVGGAIEEQDLDVIYRVINEHLAK